MISERRPSLAFFQELYADQAGNQPEDSDYGNKNAARLGRHTVSTASCPDVK